MTFQSPYYEQVLSYWKSLCTDDQIPTSSQFDPIKIPESLKNTTLWEMDEDDRIRCRLAGTEVVARMHVDITGSDLSAIMGPKSEHIIITDFRTALRHRCGVWYAIINRHPTGKIVISNSLILPLNPEKGGLPKFVTMQGVGGTLGYETDEAELELGRGFHERTYVDVGWGVPALENKSSA